MGNRIHAGAGRRREEPHLSLTRRGVQDLRSLAETDRLSAPERASLRLLLDELDARQPHR